MFLNRDFILDNMDNLEKHLLEFLSRYGGLSVRDSKIPSSSVRSSQGLSPYPIRTVNPPDFEPLKMKEISLEEFERMPLYDIPNNPDSALIDIGSSLGAGATRNFARRNPHVRVIMIDKMFKSSLETQMNIDRDQYKDEFVVDYADMTSDIEKLVNDIYRKNGFENVSYINHELTFDSLGLERVRLLDAKNVYVTGFNSPKGFGSLVLTFAEMMNARKIYLSQTKLEQTPLESENYHLIDDFFEDANISVKTAKRIKELFYDDGIFGKPKYEFNNEDERMFGAALKLLFAVSQKHFLEKHGYSVEIFENENSLRNLSYASPLHYIVATRK